MGGFFLKTGGRYGFALGASTEGVSLPEIDTRDDADAPLITRRCPVTDHSWPGNAFTKHRQFTYTLSGVVSDETSTLAFDQAARAPQ